MPVSSHPVPLAPGHCQAGQALHTPHCQAGTRRASDRSVGMGGSACRPGQLVCCACVSIISNNVPVCSLLGHTAVSGDATLRALSLRTLPHVPSSIYCPHKLQTSLPSQLWAHSAHDQASPEGRRGLVPRETPFPTVPSPPAVEGRAQTRASGDPPPQSCCRCVTVTWLSRLVTIPFWPLAPGRPRRPPRPSPSRRPPAPLCSPDREAIRAHLSCLLFSAPVFARCRAGCAVPSALLVCPPPPPLPAVPQGQSLTPVLTVLHPMS